MAHLEGCIQGSCYYTRWNKFKPVLPTADSKAVVLSDISCLDVKAKLAPRPTISRPWTYTGRALGSSPTLQPGVSLRCYTDSTNGLPRSVCHRLCAHALRGLEHAPRGTVRGQWTL